VASTDTRIASIEMPDLILLPNVVDVSLISLTRTG